MTIINLPAIVLPLPTPAPSPVQCNTYIIKAINIIGDTNYVGGFGHF